MPDAAAIADTKLGLTLLNQSRLKDAIAAFDRALARDAAIAVAHNGRAIALSSLGRREDALVGFERALALDRNFFGAHFNRALILVDVGRFADAHAAFDAALALKPDFVPALAGRGSLMLNLGGAAAAAADFDRARALDGETAEIARDRGMALIALGRLDEAHASFERATRLDSKMSEAWFNRAMGFLTRGQLREGWPDYERRLALPPLMSRVRPFAQPRYRHDMDVAGKTVLLHAEQGIGDTIQFARYVPLIRARGARVMLEVQAPLVDLLGPFADAVVAQGAPLPPFDLHCPLPSLPLAFNTALADISGAPYLAVDSSRADRWRTRLGVKTKRRVGIVWRGSAAHGNDRNRSLTLDLLAPLFDRPGIEFFALQKDVSPAEAEMLSRHSVTTLDAVIADFADTAAIAMQLDLIITVDTSVAHLGGALGVLTWILIPYVPDWRWMLNRADSPWYASVRLFRQGTLGAWGAVISDLRTALTP